MSKTPVIGNLHDSEIAHGDRESKWGAPASWTAATEQRGVAALAWRRFCEGAWAGPTFAKAVTALRCVTAVQNLAELQTRRFMGSLHGFQAVRIDPEPAAEVGRVTPCAPLLVAPGPGARGATRPTVRFMGRLHDLKIAHRDHEPMVGRAALLHRLPPKASAARQRSPTFRFVESRWCPSRSDLQPHRSADSLVRESRPSPLNRADKAVRAP